MIAGSMSQDSSTSLLRRMASTPAAAKAGPDPALPVLERALATAAMRVADGVQSLGLTVTDRAGLVGEPDSVLDDLSDLALCLMIDPLPSDADAESVGPGVIALDPVLVDSLIEVQTIGRVDGPARAARRPTRIDAALAQPFAKDVVAEFADQIPKDHHGARPGQLRIGSYLSGPSSLGLLLTAPSYQRIDLTIGLGQGARTARLSVILPVPGAADPTDDQEFVASDPDWTAAMQAAVMAAPVRLEAVLPKVRMTLARMITLKVGDVIELDGDALSSLSLLSGTSGLGQASRRRMPDKVRVEAKLGQLHGDRAVRILALPGQPRQDLVDPAALPNLDAAGDGGLPSSGELDLHPLATPDAPGGDLALPDLPQMSGGLGEGLDLSALPDLPDLPEKD